MRFSSYARNLCHLKICPHFPTAIFSDYLTRYKDVSCKRNDTTDVSGCVIFSINPFSQAQAAGSSHTSPSRPSPSIGRSVGAVSPQAHMYPPQDSLAGVGGDVQEAFAQGKLGIYSRLQNIIVIIIMSSRINVS